MVKSRFTEMKRQRYQFGGAPKRSPIGVVHLNPVCLSDSALTLQFSLAECVNVGVGVRDG
jgi:hypothetical protein